MVKQIEQSCEVFEYFFLSSALKVWYLITLLKDFYLILNISFKKY